MEKKSSVGNIKVPILSYQFANNSKFFIISTAQRIEVFRNFGPFEDSKVFKKINLSDYTLSGIDCASLYISSGESNRVDGYIAYGSGADLCLLDIEGNELAIVKNVVENRFIGIKLIRQDQKLVCICGNRDGRFSTYKFDFSI